MYYILHLSSFENIVLILIYILNGTKLKSNFEFLI